MVVYLLTAVGLTPGGSGTVHIYTQTVHRTTQLTALVGRLSGIRTQMVTLKLTYVFENSVYMFLYYFMFIISYYIVLCITLYNCILF